MGKEIGENFQRLYVAIPGFVFLRVQRVEGSRIVTMHFFVNCREHLAYYLDEFTFRFNRRNSRSRGKLSLRLAEQAVAVGPAPYKSIVTCYARADGVNHNI